MMDNRVFNVNGRTKAQFVATLHLLLLDEWEHRIKEDSGVKAFRIDPKKGLILLWHPNEKNGKNQPIDNLLTEEIMKKLGLIKELRNFKLTKLKNEKSTISFELLSEMLWFWLQNANPRDFELGRWEDRLNDSDVSEEPGFVIYTDEWGHIKDGYSLDHYSIGAIKPIYCWYGK